MRTPKINTLASRFHCVIKREGWDQNSTARALGVCQATVSKILSKGSEPKATTLLRLARLTGCDLGWLIDGKLLQPKAKASSPETTHEEPQAKLKYHMRSFILSRDNALRARAAGDINGARFWAGYCRWDMAEIRDLIGRCGAA